MPEKDNLGTPPKQEELRTKLTHLLEQFRGDDSKITKRFAYLNTPEGKEILKLAMALDFEWKELTQILARDRTVILKAFSFHGLNKKRRRTITWSQERIDIVGHFYRESQRLQNQSESAEFSNKMIEEVNKLPGPKMSIYAIRGRAKTSSFGAWGWNANKHTQSAVKKEKRVPRVFEEIEELKKYIADFISTGEIHKHTIKNLYNLMMKDYGKLIKEKGHKLAVVTFERYLLSLVWTDEHLKTLKDALEDGLTVKEWQKFHAVVPLSWAQERATRLTGLSNKTKKAVEFTRGLGNFGEAFKDLPIVKFPKNNFKRPFDIAQRGANETLTFLNGANIGTIHGRIMEDNPVRRKLVDAELRGDSAVFATNLIEMRIAKAAGPLGVLRSLAEGFNTTVNILDKDYQKEAERILKDLPDDELIYVTDEEVANTLLSGWRKIATRPDDQPEYSGPIKIVLGFKEEAIIASIAYWRMAAITRLKKRRLEALIRAASTARTKSKKEGNELEITHLSREIEKLDDQLSRTIVSHIRSDMKQRFFKKARAYVVKMLEDSIPNSEVVGMGTTLFRFCNKIIELNIPSGEAVTNNVLANYTITHGPKVLRGEFADATVICHPYALHYQSTVRENDNRGQRGSSEVFVAPILIDDALVREKLGETIRKAHNISKVVLNEQFRPGSLRLVFSNGIIQPDELSIDSLGTHGEFKTKIFRKNKVEIPISGSYRYPAYIWILLATDMHFGSRARAWIWDPVREMKLGMAEAVFELMRRNGLENCPVHMFATLDDETQGNHFEGHKQLSPLEVTYAVYHLQIQSLIRKARNSRTKSDVLRHMESLRDFVLTQKLLSPPDYVGAQMEQVFSLLLESNVDVFSAILSRFMQAGLKIRGLSHFTGVISDNRDIGVIVFGTGNHFGKSANFALTEGTLYAQALRYLLLALPEWSDKKELLGTLVKAPLYSNQAKGWGTIQAPGGYEYGLDFRDSPPKMAGWNDPLKGWVSIDPQRGNYSRIFDVGMTLKMCGDKHFDTDTSTPYALYHMGSAGVATDQFGELGFPPNGTGVSFVGLPANGPKDPILRRTLRYDAMKELIENNVEFDWESFLPNPV